MFFFLSKALLFIISPFFWIVVSFLYFIFGKHPKWKERAKWNALIFLFFFTNTVLYSESCRLWEIEGTKIEKVKHHDVAIIPGGMFEYNNDLSRLSARRQTDRLFQAIQLYKLGKVDKLFITGKSGHIIDRGLHEAKQTKEVLINWGIPEIDIITEENSVNTYENAKFSANVLKQSHPELKSFLLVTSGIHMRRSLACFNAQGIQCDSFSTDMYSNRNRSYQWDQYFVPNVSNLVSWNNLIKEIVGYIAYDVVGYI